MGLCLTENNGPWSIGSKVWQRRLARDEDRKGLGIYANALHCFARLTGPNEVVKARQLGITCLLQFSRFTNYTTAFFLSISAFHDQKVPRYIPSDYFGSSAFVMR